jgi:dUTP pyrophosphatase
MHYPVYTLDLVCEEPELRQTYEKAAQAHNEAVDRRDAAISSVCCDAGFDLFVPESMSIGPRETGKVGHKIHCSMRFDIGSGNPLPCGYYLYPRSSTGTKTPLRLANSVGIIDSGYRGEIIAALDNTGVVPYEVSAGSRLAQICPPNMTYPIRVRVLSSRDQLNATDRGEGGFGSTGA